MLVNVDVAEVYDCNYRVANLLLKHGWKLLHSYTRINGEVDGIASAESRYSLYRTKDVDYSAETAETEAADDICPF
jgi:hypothetical protein